MTLDRLQLLENWLKTEFPGKSFELSAASADASFRRYFRIIMDQQSIIAMDAPPQLENCAPFLHAAEVFVTANVHVPTILTQNLTQGFLLLSDLGNTTYLQTLQTNPATADRLYGDATDALIKIQLISQTNTFPEYDAALLRKELDLFTEWYVARHLQVILSQKQIDDLAAIFSRILENNLAQPKVFVHRDYHSRNLMMATPNPGILDFQDAVYGPITYDLVSLFKDAYIHWEEERILDWVIRYWEKARKAGLPVSTNFSNFYRDFEWMGVQRHLKVLGIFARLYHRDHKEAYLKDMPLVMTYLRKACERYRELHPLLNLLDQLEGIQPDTKMGYTF
jgi:aminoglycoside/choline kinase family phosphotransferase